MGLFDFMKKKDPLTDWEKTQKGETPTSEEKGFASKVAGAATGAASKASDWVINREKKLREDYKQKQAQKQYDKGVEEQFWEDASDVKFAKSRASMPGGQFPPSMEKRIPGITKRSVTGEFDVRAEAEELGIDPMKRIPQRVQVKSPETGQLTWVTQMYSIPKSVAELRLEIIEYKAIREGSEHELKMRRGLQKAEPFIIGAQMATGAMHGAAKVISSSAQSPNLRPMGRGSGSVTPMGIRGGSRLFQAPSSRGSVGGVSPVPGAGLEGLRRQMFPGQSQGPTSSSKKIRPF